MVTGNHGRLRGWMSATTTMGNMLMWHKIIGCKKKLENWEGGIEEDHLRFDEL